MITWDDLAAVTLARQFPPDPGSVPARVAAIGAMQTQTARSTHLGLAARFPDVTRDEIAAAFEDGTIVRGSSLRGTVHTSTVADHVLLDAATRVAQHTRWKRQLGLDRLTVDDVRAELERFAADSWRTSPELANHLAGWLTKADPGARPQLDLTQGRYLAHGHSALVRRPLSGGWEGQGKPVYRRAAMVDPAAPLSALVRRYLECHGPASRRDLQWWSGLSLSVVDAALTDLPGLTSETGPDGETYVDLPAHSPSPTPPLTGVRLVPEFDALLCAYRPAARARFVTPEHHDRLWIKSNGLSLAPLLVDRRLTGFWRIPGNGRQRPLEVTWFRRTRRPRKSEFEAPVAALEAAYGVDITGVRLTAE